MAPTSRGSAECHLTPCWSRRAMAKRIGTAAPGVFVGSAAGLTDDRGTPRSHRPSTRQTAPRELTARTGEPLWPWTTGWLSEGMSASAGRNYPTSWFRRRALFPARRLRARTRNFLHFANFLDEAKALKLPRRERLPRNPEAQMPPCTFHRTDLAWRAESLHRAANPWRSPVTFRSRGGVSACLTRMYGWPPSRNVSSTCATVNR